MPSLAKYKETEVVGEFPFVCNAIILVEISDFAQRPDDECYGDFATVDPSSAALYKLLNAPSGPSGKATMKYPDDANGDALRRMEAQGDDLTRPRNVEFTVVFPSENAATQFADHIRTLGYSASAELTETVTGFPWDVVVVRHMIPSHEGIGTFEDSLKGVADTYGGHNDGWRCLSSTVAPQPPPTGR